MNTNVSLLTTVASQVTDKRILDYEVAVYKHLKGDWSEHTELNVYNTPFQVTDQSVTSGVYSTTIYGSAVNTGSGITLSGELTSFSSTTVNYPSPWKPVEGISKFGADVTATFLATAPTTVYSFTLHANAVGYLFVDNTMVLKSTQGVTNTAVVTLAPGLHTLEVQYKAGASLIMILPNGLSLVSTGTAGSNLSDSTLRLALDMQNPTTLTAGSKVIAVPCLTGLGIFAPSHTPVIIEQPISALVKLGSSALFSVIAICDYQMSYQWYLNSNPISGAVSSVYTISSTAYANAGDYTVVVSTSTGSATSLAAKLTLIS